MNIVMSRGGVYVACTYVSGQDIVAAQQNFPSRVSAVRIHKRADYEEVVGEDKEVPGFP